ncbi:Cyclin-F like [Actinidia chinensis var. chinensis]|uniref:Cyclin-F like n=1 Tax=Actinidia chinensis var. chinensis TaxID=1590841 RepID=A0A2R6PM53_ACTCC|nr:Cyclin-F like [Actinidia chinensis var. chinensis]
MKKEKGVVIADHESCSEAEEEEREETSTDFSIAAVKFCTRNASSKYDFVKVKVWLGDNADHYYVLSRFLLSRMLTVIKDKDKLISNLKMIQDYHCSFKSQLQHSLKHLIGFIVISFSALSKIYHPFLKEVVRRQLRIRSHGNVTGR